MADSILVVTGLPARFLANSDPYSDVFNANTTMRGG